ncbi:MAG: helix-turn-helix transcriptional regulator [Melioribacteraceae bacterium]|nr:helix-turn-helix transcriptional regulator [Melioribacteraceae bacterium]
MQSKNRLYIKNMVCPRCIKVVKEELEKLGVKILSINLGEVETARPREELPLQQISQVLKANGFELIEDAKSKIIESVKNEVISSIQQYEEIDLETINFSKLLSKKVGKDYNYLSSLFSKIEGITIEHYIILQKIEKAKEFLKYGDQTLSEISYRLGYSSVQHLSRQFKNTTGMTASQFKNNQSNLRKSIDSIGDY